MNGYVLYNPALYFYVFSGCRPRLLCVEGMQRKSFLSALLKKIRATDLVLIAIGCVFYLWACLDDLYRLLVYILAVYLLGILLKKTRGKYITVHQAECEGGEHRVSLALPILFLSVLFTVAALIHFKYTGMLSEILGFLLKDTVTLPSIIAPLGISFITFSAISYLADIYYGKADPGSLIDCALYITFFPKVVSGPIVLWRDFSAQMRTHAVSLSRISDGIGRVMIGCAKKLILADTFGAVIASVPQEMDALTAAGIGLLYMLQIYYDFSGYSDIAIGLSGMLGFEMKENFNFPYLSTSITEFWRRWHISLGTWFREYIYFPLGGSRKGKVRTVVNIAVVFLLTGIWHGAGWTYMLWGIVNGVCNVAEKLLSGCKIYEKTPKALKWLATMTVTYFCWGLFRFPTFEAFRAWLRVMLGITRFAEIPYSAAYYFDTRITVLVIVAALGATVWGLPAVQRLSDRVKTHPAGYLLSQTVRMLLFVVAMLFMINSDYSPFIYFQY